MRGSQLKKGSFFSIFLLLILFQAAGQDVLPGYIGFWQNHREISVIDLIPFYPTELGKIRNEIFARYGRAFNTPKYQEYFAQKDWYRIVEEYRDSWPDSIDMENAQVIFSVERPKYSHDEVYAFVLENLEYSGSNATINFTGRDKLVWFDSRVDFGGMYGTNGSNARRLNWRPFGDWILIYNDRYVVFDVIAYRLDHEALTIEEMVFQTVPSDTFEIFLRAN